MSRPNCGTPQGYRYHLKFHERACIPCGDAHRENENAYRILSGKNKAVRMPADILGALLAVADRATRSRVEKSLGATVANACLVVAARSQP
jgi:hypothetical protein